MVELLAIGFASATKWLWSRALVGRALTVLLWGGYGVGLPKATAWSEETLPEAVNLTLPLLGLLAATIQGVRHWRHTHHHPHVQKHPAEPVV